MKSQIKLMLLFLLAVSLTYSAVLAKDKNGTVRKQNLLKITSGNPKALMNINNLTSWIRSDGYYYCELSTSWNGEFPRMSNIGFVYQEGIVFGGFVTDGLGVSLRVTGNTYFQGLQAGVIKSDLSTEDPKDASVKRVWAVRPDMPPTIEGSKSEWPDLSVDATTYYRPANGNSYSATSSDIQTIATQYFTDWKEWPAAKGAPWYIDSVKIVRNDPTFDHANPHHIPGIPGAGKTVWYVCNDMNVATTAIFAGSPPIGIEQQVTTWAYASSNPLNNMIFKQVKLIYKGRPGGLSNSRIDSMYIVQWSDGDLGDYGDDYAGCDSSLSLGYQYNSTTIDAKYAAVGLPAPAGGYAFLQGVSHYTGESTDSAVINLQWRHGYKYWQTPPLKVFDYFAANTGINDPVDGVYDGTDQWYNLMMGFLPIPQYPAAQPFDTTIGGSKYLLSGDPTTGQGNIDGKLLAAGDRRIVNSHGPFSMNLGDTAEVVVAEVGGMGADNLSSVKVLKYNTTFALFAYNALFNLPAPPPNPRVTVDAMDKQIILDWANSFSINTIETSNNLGFAFEGYNVYQLPSPSSAISASKRIATYDIKGDNVTVIIAPSLDPSGVIVTSPVEFGSESGIKRTITIDRDYLRSRDLVNGQEYYYAITAYSYNSEWNVPGAVNAAPFPSLESAPVVITVVPHSTNPGIRISRRPGDTLAVTHTSKTGSTSDGSVVPIVVEPDKLTGHTYQVIFDSTGATWSLIDTTLHTVVLANQTNQSGDNNYAVVDGIQVIVQGPRPGMKEWELPNGPRHFSPVGGFLGLGLEGFSTAADPTAYDVDKGTIGMASHFAFGGIGTTLTDPLQYHTVKLVLAAVDPAALWNPLVAPTDPNISLGYRWLRHAANGAADPAFAPWIINPTSGYAYQDFNYSVPFSAWDMSTTPPTRLAVGMFENNDPGASVDGRYWPPQASNGDNTVNREFAFIFADPYSTTPKPEYQTNLSNNTSLPIMWVMTCNIRNTNPWVSGDEFQIDAAVVNGSADLFTFTATAPTYNLGTAKADVDKINVFPNPYYGVNPREINRLNKFVTFNHLPTNATIRIFNLAGVLVKTIQKHDATTQFATWNLNNESNLPVASGIYIIHVDMSDLGKSKILKFALVQEQQILPIY